MTQLLDRLGAEHVRNVATNSTTDVIPCGGVGGE